MSEPPFDYGRYEEGRHVNYWRLNRPLRREARRAYPDAAFAWAEPKLDAFGAAVGDTIADNADVVDEHGPELRTHDRDGESANEVRYHPAQLENERLVYGSGIVADAFRPPPDREKPVGLLHTLTLQLLLAYADTGLVCAQSMTAGAALVLENHDEAGHYGAYLEGLTARAYDDVIEGAMFLTERQGGSDVGAIETVAEPRSPPGDSDDATEAPPGDSDDATEAPPENSGDATEAPPESRIYELTGTKWFCSNVDAQATLALARRPEAPAGTAGLSMFLVPHVLPDGTLNDQRYRRLKDKLGTTSVPTGEVEFDGTTAYLVGEPERGFAYMTTMLNWERVTNAVGAVGIVGRCLLESAIHAANREAFGRPIAEFPLMRRDLLEMAVDHEAILAFAMETARRFDRYERDRDDREAFRLMRLLVPVSKHCTAQVALETTSYAMEIRGGNGYVNEFVTSRLSRDAHALPIWEGTSNVLALDVLRAIEREDAHEVLFPFVRAHLDAASHPHLVALAETVRGELEGLEEAIAALSTATEADAQHGAKELTEYVFEVVTGALLIERAQHELGRDHDARKAIVAERFVRRTFGDDRGIADGAGSAMEQFDAVVRYDRLDPAALDHPA